MEKIKRWISLLLAAVMCAAMVVQPMTSFAGGTYTAGISNIAGLRAILYYGYGGPGFDDPNYGAKKIFDFSADEISKDG